MEPKSLIFKDYFFTVAKALEATSPPVKVIEFCENVGVTENQLRDVLDTLQSFNLFFKIKSQKGELLLEYPQKLKKVKTEFHLSEMLSVYELLNSPMLSHYEYNTKPLKNKLNEFFKRLDVDPSQITLEVPVGEGEEHKDFHDEKIKNHSSVIEKIEEGVDEEKVVIGKINSGKVLEVFPHRVVHLEQEFHLVGEDCTDKCLVYVPLSLFHEVSLEESNYQKNFSKKEVEDFISALGHISEETERIVLKVFDREVLERLPSSHFMAEEPYITTNAQQETIWAASVFVSEELYEWLYSVNEHIEILDPQNFIAHYEDYLHNTGRKNSFKKAS